MPDIRNPYLRGLPVETNTDQELVIRDLSTDQEYPAGHTSEHSTINPDGTKRTSEVTEELLYTTDGQLIVNVRTDKVYPCRSCEIKGLHGRAVGQCEECGFIVCRKCIEVINDNGELTMFCKSCYRSWRKEWFLSLNA